MSLQGLTSLIAQSAAFLDLADEVRAQQLTRALGLPRAARPFVVAVLAQALQRPLIYIAASVDGSRAMADTLNALGTPALRFTEPNTAFYDNVAPVREVIAQRSVVLATLTTDDRRPTTAQSMVSGRSPIIVCSPRALMHPTLSASDFERATRTLKRDQSISLESLVAHWVSIGYESEQVVERLGTFSRRGGIIDIWSPAHALPVRIELFGNQIDSIRYFDPGTQRSGERVDVVRLTPLEAKYEVEGKKDELSAARISLHPSSFILHPSILDHLAKNVLIIIDDEDELAASWESLESKAQREYETIARSTGVDADDDDPSDDEPTEAAMLNDQTKPYIPWCDFANQLNLRYSVTLGQALEEEALSVHPFASHFSAAPHFAGQLPPLLEYLGTQIDDRRLTSDDRSGDQSSIIIVSRQAARLAEVWSEKHSSLAASTDMDDPPQGQLNFVVGALPEGFIFKNEEVRRQNEEKNAVGKSPFFTLPSSFSILTDAEIFGWYIGLRL